MSTWLTLRTEAVEHVFSGYLLDDFIMLSSRLTKVLPHHDKAALIRCVLEYLLYVRILHLRNAINEHFDDELFKHAAWQLLSFKSAWSVFLNRVPGTKPPHEEAAIMGRSPFLLKCTAKGESILGFLPSSVFVESCSTEKLQLHLDVSWPPTTRPSSLQRWPRQRHESAVGLQSCDSAVQGGSLMTIDWHWTGHAGGDGASVCACGCLSRSGRCAHHSVLCRRQCSRLIYCCLQECIMTLFICQTEPLHRWNAAWSEWFTIPRLLASDHK